MIIKKKSDFSDCMANIIQFKRGDIIGVESFFNHDYQIFEATCEETGSLLVI